MITLTKNWQTIGTYRYQPGTGFICEFYLDAKYSTQDIPNNKTTIQTRLRSAVIQGYGSGYNYSFSCSYANTVSGTGSWNLENETITNGEGVISHENDGTKNVALSANMSISGIGMSGSISATVSLPTIPRTSDIACTSPKVGDVAMVTLTRKASAYRDTVSYTIGSLTGTLATKTADTSIAFNTSSIASSIYTQMGSTNKQIAGTMTVQTYNGDTLIGTKSTNFTLYAKESDCIPTITATVVDVNNTTTALTGDNNKIVKGYSNAKITYTITARNGATLTSKTVNGATLGTSPYTINGATTNVFTIVATDSRGYSKTLTITKTLINYVPLAINFNAFRPTPTGSEIKVNFSGNYYNGSFGSTSNTLTLSWKYRLKGASSWTNGGNFTLNTHYKISGNTFYSGTGSSASDISLSTSLFPYNNVYEIGIFYADKLISTNTVKAVPKGKPIANWDDENFNVNGKLNVEKAASFKSTSTFTGASTFNGAINGNSGGTLKGNYKFQNPKNIQVYNGSSWINLFVD